MTCPSGKMVFATKEDAEKDLRTARVRTRTQPRAGRPAFEYKKVHIYKCTYTGCYGYHLSSQSPKQYKRKIKQLTKAND